MCHPADARGLQTARVRRPTLPALLEATSLGFQRQTGSAKKRKTLLFSRDLKKMATALFGSTILQVIRYAFFVEGKSEESGDFASLSVRFFSEENHHAASWTFRQGRLSTGGSLYGE